MISKKFIFAKVEDTTEKDLPVLCIPSYRRPHFELTKRILPNFTKEALDKTFIFVRHEQLNEYYKANPYLQYVSIPTGAVTGVGSTRQFMLDWAITNKIACIMDMDDDIKYLCYLWNKQNSVGNWISAHTVNADLETDPQLPQKILQLAGKISREIFKEHPDVVLGNIRKQHFSHHTDYAQIKYQINKGVTPRQTKIINVKAVAKHKIFMPMEFDLHGDDIGYAAEVLQRGFSCFNIPCLTYDYVDDATNSVVRDWTKPESTANRRLHKLEYDALQNMEIKHYLRETFKFPDGQYKFGDINWQRYHKLHGTKPIIRYWRNK